MPSTTNTRTITYSRRIIAYNSYLYKVSSLMIWIGYIDYHVSHELHFMCQNKNNTLKANRIEQFVKEKLSKG